MGILTEQTKTAIQAAIRKYPEKRSASIAALRAAQYQLGWLSPEVVEEVGAEMELDSNGLYQLVTFYDMFYDHPVGTFVIGVCNNLSCYLRGADSLFEYLQKKLGIGPEETTPDGLFTLRTVECLAACGNAPAMMVNEEYFENLDFQKVDEMLEELRGRAKAMVLKGKKIGELEVTRRTVGGARGRVGEGESERAREGESAGVRDSQNPELRTQNPTQDSGPSTQDIPGGRP